MKSIKKSAAALVVLAAAIGMMGCKHEPKHVHTWDYEDYKYDSESGKDIRTCTVCSYVDEKDHVHGSETTWTINAISHKETYDCCGAIKTAEASHNWNHADFQLDSLSGKNSRECTICSYIEIKPEGFVSVTGTEIKGTETWTPKTRVFVKSRQLIIPTLLVCEHEVTRGEFKAVMGIDPSTVEAYDKDGNKLTGDAVLNNPVGTVNWYNAIAYCNKLSIKENLTPCYTVEGITDWEKLEYSSIPTSSNTTWDAVKCDFTANGYRLPTEAEWEWLARGGENYKYAGSDTVDEVAWYTDITNDTGSREVKTKKKNGYDLYDMSGNAYEWCWDWYDTISSSSAATGAASGSKRVHRGGSWYGYDFHCEVADRISDNPFSRGLSYGFRVVRTSSN